VLRILVTYDITEDKERKKISDCCLDYGLDRQQYSVFTGLLKPIHIRALAKALRPYVGSGQVIILPISSDDWEKRIEIGTAGDDE
jgi:CRISPR-associated protein Cas2